MTYKFNADLQVQHSAEDSVLLVLGAYSLVMRALPADHPADEPERDDSDSDELLADQPEGDATEPVDVATFGFKLNALFVVEDEPDEPFTESELTAFGQTTGQFALYPYAREFVADLTGRMGLPPLHMGVMRLHLVSREG